MTRINCVPPSELCREHLIAEYKELPRIFSLARSMVERELPPWKAEGPYILGPGHMKSFTGRLIWLSTRFLALVREMRARGYKTTYTDIPDWAWSLPRPFWGDWSPTKADLEVSRQRIRDRMPKKAA